jgi:hypothetical protein
VPNDQADADGPELAEPAPGRVADSEKPAQDLLGTVATIGAIAAGVALFEVALLPGMAIGAAAVLAPKYLPTLRRRLQPLFDAAVSRQSEPGVAAPDRSSVLQATAERLGIGQANCSNSRSRPPTSSATGRWCRFRLPNSRPATTS